MTDRQQSFRLILASGSPRRRELLTRMGYRFEIIKPEVNEDVQASAEKAVGILSRRKADAVASGLDHGIIIASDTLVALDGQALGKPVDAMDARRMLGMLSGHTHDVFTGVTLADAALASRRMTRIVRTGVRFRILTDDEIDRYVAGGEPMDKAGAYAIQGGAGTFVEALDGSFDNVVGFPVDTIEEMLTAFTRQDIT